MDGTYGTVFSGAAGVGMGFFEVRDGILTGRGVAGGKIEGSVTSGPATGALHLVLKQFVPPGLVLVQGTSPQELGITKQIEFDMSADFGDGEAIKLYIPPGYVTIMIKRMPDEYAALARGEKVLVVQSGTT